MGMCGMITRRGIIGTGLIALNALLMPGCTQYPKHVYRFKLTVEVETPQGLRSGYSVYEVTAQKHAKFLPEARARSRDVRGEAVAVDLPGGKTLFALLKTMNQSGDDNLAYLSMATLDPAYQNDWVESAQRIAMGVGLTSPAEVLPENYPMLVTFRDLTDPASLELVDPKNLTATFGPGVRLRRLTAEVIEVPMTTGIEKRLDKYFWSAWGRIRQEEISRPGGVMENPYFKTLQSKLSRNDFTTENTK
jgi:hypothetical protein